MSFLGQIKNIIITGANRGIGLQIVDSLLNCSQKQISPKHNIIMTSRDKYKGIDAFQSMLSAYPTNSLFFFELDVSNKNSIEKFYQNYKQKFDKLDILINNAGIYVQGDQLQTQYQPIDNIDQTLSANFYGLVNITEKLLPMLTSNGKIISVTSELALLKYQPEEGQLALGDQNLDKQKLFQIAEEYRTLNMNKTNNKYSKSVYEFSKALVNTYNRCVLTKLTKDDQLAITLDSGYCRTDMSRIAACDSKLRPKLTVQQAVNHILYVLFEIPFKANSEINGKHFQYNAKKSLI